MLVYNVDMKTYHPYIKISNIHLKVYLIHNGLFACMHVAYFHECHEYNHTSTPTANKTTNMNRICTCKLKQLTPLKCSLSDTTLHHRPKGHYTSYTL